METDYINQHKRNLVYALFCCLLLTACSWGTQRPEKASSQAEEPEIFPDYRDVTVPVNISPLNFRLTREADHQYVLITGEKGGRLECDGQRSLRFDPDAWRKLLEENAGSSLTLTCSSREAGGWKTWKSFQIHVDERPIDSHLVYRLIEPGYEKWHIVGIYQRDLESFDEKTIIRNDMTGYNCINCHSFCMNDPNRMMLHMRAVHDGTYIIRGKEIERLKTKTKQTISNLTYPYWHPSGKYITTSVNDIKQFFHAVKEKKMEVFDLESDVVVYDVEQHKILSAASLITKDAFETFPAFSPDGKWLYFCSAPACEMPADYDKVRYHICRMAFDAGKGALQLPVDTLVRADSLSYTFPRISPDGRFLMYTETAYGQFPVWHKDAEIRMLELETRQPVDMTLLNSADTESYHSWSSQSDWVVFSSRRDNGLYTLPYICRIQADGRPAKPFLLPQEDPEKYDYQLYSYNLPELVTDEVTISPYAIQQRAHEGPTTQVAFE